MKKIIITISMILTTISALGQDIDLTLLPKAERDSILLERAKEVVLKYGDTEFYNVERKPLISHNKNSRISYNETAHVYVVTYLYDPYKYVMNNAFSASVKIFANTGKVYDVFFGVGRGAYNLHINEYDGHFSYRQSETNPQLAARIIEKQQYLIDRAAEYEREGVTIEAGSVGGGTIKPPTTRPSK